MNGAAGCEAAARFYAKTFPQSSVGAVHRAPADYPDGKAGNALTVEFTVAGIPCIGLNGGPHFKHSEAFSSAMAGRKASAAGARTNGASVGRSSRVC